jgi:hypothetical protein
VIPVLYTIWRTRQLAAARGAIRMVAAGDAPASDITIPMPSNGVATPTSRPSKNRNGRVSTT